MIEHGTSKTPSEHSESLEGPVHPCALGLAKCVRTAKKLGFLCQDCNSKGAGHGDRPAVPSDSVIAGPCPFQRHGVGSREGHFGMVTKGSGGLEGLAMRKYSPKKDRKFL